MTLFWSAVSIYAVAMLYICVCNYRAIQIDADPNDPATYRFWRWLGQKNREFT